MNFLDDLERRLRKYPEAVIERSSSTLVVKASDKSGFDVSCQSSGSGHLISFAGWHENFSDDEDARSWFAFGLSEKCRLRVYRRGSFDHRWQVEDLREGEWHLRGEVGLLIYPFFLSRNVRLLQNHLLPSEPLAHG